MCKVDKNLTDKVLCNIRSGESGIATGLIDLDHVIGGGLQEGCFYVLGGRPAMGKTALALNILCNAIDNGVNVTYFSLEMSKEKLIERLMYMMAHISLPRTADGLSEEDWKKLIDAAKMISESGLIVDDTPSISVEEIGWQKMCQPGYQDSQLIIIDYIQLLNAHICVDEYESETRQQRMDYIARELKKIARNTGIPVLGLSQLSRACERRADHRPILSDLRESAALEEMADVVMLLYRDEYYNFDSEIKGIADIIVAKNKAGYVAYTQFAYIRDYMKFANLVRK